MSGHSKWANIKHKKQLRDQRRGQVFSKISRLIAIAVREGGPDPAANPKLRLAIERAKAVNMPKENINRAIESALKKSESLEEMVLEGYGPKGVGVILEVTTDSRQRTIQELKNLFARFGGSLAEPGAVTFQFEKKGLIEIVRPQKEDVLLALIDSGVEDFEENGKTILLWTAPSSLEAVKSKVEEQGLEIKRFSLWYRPKTTLVVDEAAAARRVLEFLEAVEAHEDVQQVFANVEIPAAVLAAIGYE